MSSEVNVFPFSFLLHDWRLAVPTPMDKSISAITGKIADRVPVIRLFGYSAPLQAPKALAKQCCVNVHGYFPKLFIDEIHHMALPDLAELIDAKLGGVCVYNITRLVRTNFYGYNESPIPVLAVEVFRPVDVSRIAELVSTAPGALGSANPIRPYEVHIPYLLQFLVEHGIQGVTPFYLDPRKVILTKLKSTIVDLEISVTPDAIILAAPSAGSQRDYPVPPPLSPACDDLVCEVLQSLWKEEFERTAPGEKFPYYPEGMVDGIDRPDCSETPWVTKRKERLLQWADRLQQAEPSLTPNPSTQDNTQALMHGLGELGMFDMSLGDESSITQVLVRTAEFSSHTANTAHQSSLVTQTVHQLTATEAQLTPTDVEMDSPAPPRLTEPTAHAVEPPATVKQQPLVLPSTPCLLRYSARPPRISTRLSQTSVVDSQNPDRMSLTGNTQAVTAPMRAGKPAPIPESRTSTHLTFGTMAVIEIVTDVPSNCSNSDPNRDAILAISCLFIDERLDDKDRRIVFMWHPDDVHPSSLLPSKVKMIISKNECAMMENFRNELFFKLDPTVVLSWDCTRHSVGYVLARAHALGLGLARYSLSRVVQDPAAQAKSNQQVFKLESLAGRLLVDLWRVLRNDAESGLRLGTTSLEGVCQSVLGITVPAMTDSVLAAWWREDGIRGVSRVLQRLVKQTVIVAELADVTRVMPRATEMARLYGMDLESTFTRGSQFRVECMLVRASRKLGYVLPSSSKAQVKSQSATEGIPMVLEPHSGLITDPVIVFDFQSLYPSLVIGYNMCFSTCMGRVSCPTPETRLGTQSGLVRSAAAARSAINVPSDVAFVQRAARVGLLPRICHELLQTRIMVKKSMKVGNKSPGLLKQLDARQLSLKLLSNVIYGYSTASFSGRMPCAELADSIVLTGRESLENVMRTAESMGGVIVYGDTDSLFVRLPGKSVDQAFAFGALLVDRVAKDHPWPMKLILEKVYHPCCLVTKKRYVGRAFDTISSEPRLDAKGIETIRRDTCPAVAVTVERILNAVFEACDGAQLEPACIREFARILKGGLPNKFFVFQNQVRELTQYKDPKHLPPAAKVAVDTGRTDAVRGERIAYVISQGPLGSKLSEQVKPPDVLLLSDSSKRERLNLDYYLTKQVIPAIQRIFGPIANRAFTWLAVARSIAGNRKIETPLLHSQSCFLCGSTTASSIFRGMAKVPLFCSHCISVRGSQAVAAGEDSVREAEHRLIELRKVCVDCVGVPDGVDRCTDAWHCETYFERALTAHDVRRAYASRQRIGCESRDL